MLPFGPRRYRFLRDIHGAIADVRPAHDPVFDTLWLEDPDVRELFSAQDRAWRLSHGGCIEDEHDRQQAEARLRHRLTMRRIR